MIVELEDRENDVSDLIQAACRAFALSHPSKFDLFAPTSSSQDGAALEVVEEVVLRRSREITEKDTGTVFILRKRTVQAPQEKKKFYVKKMLQADADAVSLRLLPATATVRDLILAAHEVIDFGQDFDLAEIKVTCAGEGEVLVQAQTLGAARVERFFTLHFPATNVRLPPQGKHLFEVGVAPKMKNGMGVGIGMGPYTQQKAKCVECKSFIEPGQLRFSVGAWVPKNGNDVFWPSWKHARCFEVRWATNPDNSTTLKQLSAVTLHGLDGLDSKMKHVAFALLEQVGGPNAAHQEAAKMSSIRDGLNRLSTGSNLSLPSQVVSRGPSLGSVVASENQCLPPQQQTAAAVVLHHPPTEEQQAIINLIVHLASLSPANKKKVRVTAGPGTGKTKTTVDAVLAAAAKCGAHIVLPVFSRAAVEALNARLRGGNNASTIHSICMRLLPGTVLDEKKSLKQLLFPYIKDASTADGGGGSRGRKKNKTPLEIQLETAAKDILGDEVASNYPHTAIYKMEQMIKDQVVAMFDRILSSVESNLDTFLDDQHKRCGKQKTFDEWLDRLIKRIYTSCQKEKAQKNQEDNVQARAAIDWDQELRPCRDRYKARSIFLYKAILGKFWGKYTEWARNLNFKDSDTGSSSLPWTHSLYPKVVHCELLRWSAHKEEKLREEGEAAQRKGDAVPQPAMAPPPVPQPAAQPQPGASFAEGIGMGVGMGFAMDGYEAPNLDDEEDAMPVPFQLPIPSLPVASCTFTSRLPDVAQSDPPGVVIVDEAQDLTPLQFDLMERLYPNKSLVVVGDPVQSIMGFRGAQPWNFETEFKPSERETEEDGGRSYDLQLSVSFRFGSHLATVYNSFLALRRKMFEEEGRSVSKHLFQLNTVPGKAPGVVRVTPKVFSVPEIRTLLEKSLPGKEGEQMCFIARYNESAISTALKLLEVVGNGTGFNDNKVVVKVQLGGGKVDSFVRDYQTVLAFLLERSDPAGWNHPLFKESVYSQRLHGITLEESSKELSKGLGDYADWISLLNNVKSKVNETLAGLGDVNEGTTGVNNTIITIAKNINTYLLQEVYPGFDPLTGKTTNRDELGDVDVDEVPQESWDVKTRKACQQPKQVIAVVTTLVEMLARLQETGEHNAQDDPNKTTTLIASISHQVKGLEFDHVVVLPGDEFAGCPVIETPEETRKRLHENATRRAGRGVGMLDVTWEYARHLPEEDSSDDEGDEDTPLVAQMRTLQADELGTCYVAQTRAKKSLWIPEGLMEVATRAAEHQEGDLTGAVLDEEDTTRASTLKDEAVTWEQVVLKHQQVVAQDAMEQAQIQETFDYFMNQPVKEEVKTEVKTEGSGAPTATGARLMIKEETTEVHVKEEGLDDGTASARGKRNRGDQEDQEDG